MIEKFLGTYSNGWGHLIVTCVVFVSMALLLATGKVSVETFGGVTTSVLLFWFGTGVANRIAQAKGEAPTAPISPLLPPAQPTTPPLLTSLFTQPTVDLPIDDEATMILPVVKGRKNAVKTGN